MRVSVDLNSDLGESFGAWVLGDDAAMLDIVSSANVACGFHAGDPLTLRRTVATAVDRGVVIGAQVGYPDLVGFGRRFLDIAADELTAAVIYQIGALDGLARVAGSSVRYLKPHGALYHSVAVDVAQAAAVVRAVVEYDRTLPVVGLADSVFLDHAAEAGLTIVAEAFADRAYRPDGTLVPRTESGAVLHDPSAIAERVLRMLTEQRVAAVDGTSVSIRPSTVCVHGDSPGAVEMARAVRDVLQRNQIAIQPFVG